MTQITCQWDGCATVLERSPGRGRNPKWCDTHKRAMRTIHRTNMNAECSDGDCDRPTIARDMCSMHYRRWERANGRAKPPSSEWGPRRQANWRRRKALRRGAPVAETIYHDSIFARDEYTCALCGEAVDRTLKHPDPMCASLDHRIPIAHGGTHTRDNVQCTHLKCNLAKGSTYEPSALSAAR